MAPHEHGWRKYWWTSTPLLNLKIRKTLGMKGTGLFPNQHKPQLPTSCLLHSCIPNYILWYYVFLFLHQNIPKICCHRWNMLIRLRMRRTSVNAFHLLRTKALRIASTLLACRLALAWRRLSSWATQGSQDLEVVIELKAITYTYSIQM